MMCHHFPTCPISAAPDREAARVAVAHPEQGWSLLCNGVILFEDTGEILPDRSAVSPHRGSAGPICAPRAAATIGRRPVLHAA